MIDLKKWLESGKYLPKIIRDFHDQKTLFKTIDILVKDDPEAMIKRPDWITAHVYVIDTFLWFMAKRGYTLQKTRIKAEFKDLQQDFDKALKLTARF